MQRSLLLVTAIMLFAGTSVAASVSASISPSILDKGNISRGERIHGSFQVSSGQENGVEYSVTGRSGSITQFQSVRPDKVQIFSAQGCRSCLQIEREGTGTSELTEVAFSYDVPGDAESGYHMVELVPEPTSGKSAGDVSVSASLSIPVLFRVPGPVVRKGTVDSLEATSKNDGMQEIEATYSNTGNVTTKVKPVFKIEESNGRFQTVRKRAERVSPGSSTRFSTSIDTGELNNSFNTTFIADYHTDMAAQSGLLTMANDPADTDRSNRSRWNWVLVGVILLVMGIAIWTVRNHGT